MVVLLFIWSVDTGLKAGQFHPHISPGETFNSSHLVLVSGEDTASATWGNSLRLRMLDRSQKLKASKQKVLKQTTPKAATCKAALSSTGFFAPSPSLADRICLSCAHYLPYLVTQLLGPGSSFRACLHRAVDYSAIAAAGWLHVNALIPQRLLELLIHTIP